MTQTEQEIEKLKTLNDNYTELVDIFDHIVPREYVVLTLYTPSDVDWTMYSVVVTNNDKGTSDAYVIPSNGVVEFEVKYDTTYTIKLPLLGDLIAPKDLTFTAGMKMREVGYSYHMAGVFGIDANAKYYTIEQIEALTDKSIIKYGGYTDYDLENTQKDDGTYGCGFMWDLNQEDITATWASANVEFSQDLLPFVPKENAISYCDGEAYTRYILSEGARLAVETPAASTCVSKVILVGKITKRGYLPAYGQLKKLHLNVNSFKALYNALGLTVPNIFSSSQSSWTSCQYTATHAVDVVHISNSRKTYKIPVLVVFALPSL